MKQKYKTQQFNLPVSEHAMVLNSVPKGSGFLKIKDMFGNPPVLFFLGRQADIVSSKSLMTEAATCLDLFLLNSSTSCDSMYHGS